MPVRAAQHGAGSVAGLDGAAQCITEREHWNEALTRLVEATASQFDRAFFASVAVHLSKTLGADCTLIAEMHGNQVESVRTIALAVDGQLADNFEYDLAGTPCENVVRQSVCCHLSGVAEKFPDDKVLKDMGVQGYIGVPLRDSKGDALGLVAALFRKPIVDADYQEAVLRLVASRIGSELERSRSDKSLAESEQRYSDIFNTTHDAIIIHDAHSTEILDVNDRMLEMFQYTREQAMGITIGDISSGVEPYTQARALERLDRAIQEGPQLFQWQAKRGDGELFWVEVALHSTIIAGKRRVLATIRDTTERKRAEEERLDLEAQLRQSQKLEAVGQLAGGVAHDFNNILTVILGNAEMAVSQLKSDFPEATRSLEALEQVTKSSLRASSLTKQLLTFSRRDVTQPIDLNLNRILADLDSMLRRLIAEDIEFRTDTDPNLKSVRADGGQIEQVIVNLVVNAAQSMANGGQLTLTTQNVTLEEAYTNEHVDGLRGPSVLLTVTDTGHGMDAATCERIFEPFFTTKPVGKGTGLGLSMVHGIVKRSGGNVAVRSEIGCGTTFTIYLPAIEQTRGDRILALEPDTSAHGRETVLLCEDDQDIRELAAESLRTAGYTVITAGSGREGSEAAQAHAGPIDLLITDVIMPEMNGPALSERLRAARPGLLTLFISGYTSNAITRHGEIDEAVEFLQKPFTQEVLLRKVRAVLGKVRSGD